ncbi:MAG: CehA/McbA family metallohydrolase [Pseudomonadota bacterium]
MQFCAFASPGRFWRGNLHTHSDQSDGVLSPQEVCERYRAQGYDFLAITDHFAAKYDYPITDTTAHRVENFTTLLGAELHAPLLHNGDPWHILAVGLPADFAPPYVRQEGVDRPSETGPELAQRAREAGAFIAMAHPQWSGLTLEDARSLKAAHAVEAYNHTCFIGVDRADGFHTLDLLLEEGWALNLCATDDAHFKFADHFGGWVMVKAEENDPSQLLHALKAGAYYSTQGPQFFNIDLREESVLVECSAAQSIILQSRGSRTVHRHGSAITRLELPLGRLADEEWLRVTIIDPHGKRAWSNPVWR